MPTYGYECNSCNYTFDVFQNINEEPVKICPKCSKDVRRLINGGMGVIFKGSGFYVTDKNSGPGKSKGAPKSEAAACPSCPAAESCPKAVNS